MSRVFILGAGFSRALAQAPLAKDFLSKIHEHSSKDNLPNRVWQEDRNCFIKVLEYLNRITQKGFEKLGVKRSDIVNRNVKEQLHSIDIEFLCTLLELHIGYPFIPKAKDISLQGCPIPFLEGFCKEDLESARKFILHYIVVSLLPDKLMPNFSAIEKVCTFMNPEDAIITFNYDILIEQALWRRQVWNPFDGYGIEFERPDNLNVPETKIQVIKLHGSMNWLPSSVLFSLRIRTDHPFDNTPLFDGFDLNNHRGKKRARFKYPLGSHILLPTFMKTTKDFWEIQLMRSAAGAVSNAEEIFVLGYSFPESDGIANFIFSQIPLNARIVVVLFDQNLKAAKNLANRLERRYKFKNRVVYEDTRIDDWIENDFRYLSYEKARTNQKRMNRIINRQ